MPNIYYAAAGLDISSFSVTVDHTGRGFATLIVITGSAARPEGLSVEITGNFARRKRLTRCRTAGITKNAIALAAIDPLLALGVILASTGVISKFFSATRRDTLRCFLQLITLWPRLGRKAHALRADEVGEVRRIAFRTALTALATNGNTTSASARSGAVVSATIASLGKIAIRSNAEAMISWLVRLGPGLSE